MYLKDYDVIPVHGNSMRINDYIINRLYGHNGYRVSLVATANMSQADRQLLSEWIQMSYSDLNLQKTTTNEKDKKTRHFIRHVLEPYNLHFYIHAAKHCWTDL